MTSQFLAATEPFKQLSPPERQRLASVIREKRYAKGETIFRRGESADVVWIVRSGRVHLMHFLPDGKVSTACVVTKGELFCCLPTLDRKDYPLDAVAAEDTTVVCIPAAAFQRAMAQSPSFTRQTLTLFCDRLRGMEHRGCMLYEPAESRIAQVLLTLSKKFGPNIPLTRQELSELAGTTLETAIRTLSRFREQRFIRSSRGQTTLLRPEKLQSLSDGY